MKNYISMTFKPTLVVIMTTIFSAAAAAAGSLPSGEVQLGQSILEPAYNDLNRTITYLLTPMNTHQETCALEQRPTAPPFSIPWDAQHYRRAGTRRMI